VKFHIDAAAAKGYAFGFKAKTLFEARFTAQFDLAAGAEHALPGKSDGATQNSDDLTGSAGMSGSAGNGAISRDLSAGDAADGCQDGGVEGHQKYSSVDGVARRVIEPEGKAWARARCEP
jgi:hypothetical protein